MKQTRIILAILLVMILATGSVFADTVSQTVNLTAGQTTAKINGQSVTLTAPAQVVNGRTLVPLRFVGEAFGCDVNWVGTSKTATVALGSQFIEVPIGQNEVFVNGEKMAVEVPGQLINGSTFVPLRLIGESLGAKLDYDPATKAISILMHVYKNKENNFQLVLPEGWSAAGEVKEGVSLTNGADGAAIVALVEKTAGVTPTDESLDELFAENKSMAGFTATLDGNTAIASYIKDGKMNLEFYIFSETGVYFATFNAPDASFTEDFESQCYLMFSTLMDYAE